MGIRNVYGTEFSTAYRNFAKYEYEINATEEINKDIKYDMICYYHVLEHVQNPDQELSMIRNLLKDDGFLYLSVPIWEDALIEHAGGATVDFENYYHLNHVNVFTENTFLRLLTEQGYKVIKKNDKTYGYTVICIKDDKKKEHGDYVSEKWKVVADRIKKQKEVVEFIRSTPKGLDKAIEMYPNYPELYIAKASQHEQLKDFKGQMEILEQGYNVTGHRIIKMAMAKVLYQWDENTPGKQFYSNNIKKAEKILTELVELRPDEDCYYFLAQIEYLYKKNCGKAVHYIRKIAEINPTRWGEVMNYISKYWKDKG